MYECMHVCMYVRWDIDSGFSSLWDLLQHVSIPYKLISTPSYITKFTHRQLIFGDIIYTRIQPSIPIFPRRAIQKRNPEHFTQHLLWNLLPL